jgi:hypothetical protein
MFITSSLTTTFQIKRDSMYIRKSRISGRDYYAVVEAYRDEFGRAKQKLIVTLGTNPTPTEARKAAKAQIAEDEKLIARIIDEVRSTSAIGYALLPSTREDAADGQLPKWAQTKLASLRARIAENTRRLKKLDELKTSLPGAAP